MFIVLRQLVCTLGSIELVINGLGNPTLCYKIGTDPQGAPLFTLVGKTATNGAGRVGIGRTQSPQFTQFS
jgi:hypothetical protein